MKKQNKPYTKADIAKLRQHLPNMTIEDFRQAYMPERTYAAIRDLARRKGIKFIRQQDNYFTTEEDNIIRQYYPIGGSILVADKMKEMGLPYKNRSFSQRANKLGVRINEEYQLIIRSLATRKEVHKNFETKVSAIKQMIANPIGYQPTKETTDLGYKPKWKSKKYEDLYHLIDRHWNGERFERGTYEYNLLKSERIIGY